MNNDKLESLQCVKDRGVATASILTFCQQCKDAAVKAYRISGFINRYFSFNNKDINQQQYINLVRSYLKHACKFNHFTVKRVVQN